MKNFEEITYYEDVELEDGQIYGVGDYWRIELRDADTGEVVERFGDYYHDKGAEKLEGFYRGLEYTGILYSVTCKDAKDE